MLYKLLHFVLFASFLFGQSALNKNWTVFNKSNTPFPSQNVTAVAVDSSGNYWFGCSVDYSSGDHGGVAVYSGNKWTVFDTTNSPLPDNNIKYIFCGKDGKVWIASFNGLYYFDGSVWSNITAPPNQLMSVSVDHSGDIWIGSYDMGVSFKSGNLWSTYTAENSSLCGDKINFIYTDDNNTKWIGSEFGGLNRFDNNMVKTGQGDFTPDINLDVRDLKKDKQGYYWVTGYLGSFINPASAKNLLARFKDNIWTFFDSAQIGSNPFYSYNGIAVDQKNNKYLTSRDGIYVYNNSVWAKLNSPEPNSEWFDEITVDKNNNKIVVLRNYGVYLYNEDSVKILTGIAEKPFVPNSVMMYQNYPNPFNPTTEIRYSIPVTGNVSIKVYDILGKEISSLVNEQKKAGEYTVTFNGGRFPSGVYFYTIYAGNFTETKKLMLLK